MKIGIIGYGFVGQAVHSTINSDVIIHDTGVEKYKFNLSKIVLNTVIVFICVPSPRYEGYDDVVKETLATLTRSRYDGIVVVKSTITYGAIAEFEDDLNLCFNPEFLNQNTAISDAQSQSVVILGGKYEVTRKVEEFYNIHSVLLATYEHVTLKEACDFKYVRNVYGALQVLFWEAMQDCTGNSRKMSDLYKKIPFKSLNEKVGMDGYRGYGGACFPKDVERWDVEHHHDLTEFMIKYNQKLLK